MSLRRSFGFAFLSTNGNALIAFLISLVIARLLTPAEIGVFSIGYVLVGIPSLIRDFGIGAYIVQEKDLTVDRVRSAFGVMLAAAWALAAFVVVVSVPVAGFYREPVVRDILLILALNMAIVPFGALTVAYLRREMRFGPGLLIDTGGAVIGGTAAVLFAMSGFGSLSLAWSSVIGTAFAVTLALFYRPRNWPWLPGFREARRVLSFGTSVTGASLCGYLNSISPDLILGRVLGMDAVAYFGRAMGLRRIFERIVMGAVGAVALPHLSRRVRQGEGLRDEFLKSAHLITGVGWPFLAVLGILSGPAVRVLYGHQWDAAVPLVAWLSVAGMVGLPFWLTSSFVLALGDTRTNLRNEILGLAIKVIVITSAALISLNAVGIASVVTAVCGVLIWRPAVKRSLRVGIVETYAACVQSLYVTVACAAAALAVSFSMRQLDHGNFSILAAAGSAAVCCWLGAIWVLDHPLRPEVAAMLAKVFARGRRA